VSVRPADAVIAFESIVVGVSGSVRKFLHWQLFFCCVSVAAVLNSVETEILRTWDESFFCPCLNLRSSPPPLFSVSSSFGTWCYKFVAAGWSLARWSVAVAMEKERTTAEI
jgi:hypothetical protein